MEGSSSTSHFRSISFPSRLNHPSCIAIETKINELNELGNLVGSSQSIQSCLVGLAELYVSVDELVQSPRIQQAFAHHQRLVEDALEWSVGLLDSCSILKDLIMQMKDNVQILQSTLRRKGGDLTGVNQIAAYLCFRKKVKRSIIKSLGTLKHLEKKSTINSFLDVDHHVSMVSKVLGEVNALTISVFKSLLVFVSTKTKSTKGVHLLSKMLSKGISKQDKNKMLVNEIETVDTATMSLHKSASNNEMKDVDVQITVSKLQILDVSIDGFEAGLNGLFRRLIQSRASLLNIVDC